MNIAAYCRVSTDKEDQLNSLEAQKGFFAQYTPRTRLSPVRWVYLAKNSFLASRLLC